MGGLILIFLLAILIVVLVTPAARAYADRKRRERSGDSTAHDAVISRLEDHRKRRNQNNDRADG